MFVLAAIIPKRYQLYKRTVNNANFHVHRHTNAGDVVTVSLKLLHTPPPTDAYDNAKASPTKSCMYFIITLYHFLVPTLVLMCVCAIG